MLLTTLLQILKFYLHFEYCLEYKRKSKEKNVIIWSHFFNLIEVGYYFLLIIIFI